MTKRNLTGILALCLAAALLTGCGDGIRQYRGEDGAAVSPAPTASTAAAGLAADAAEPAASADPAAAPGAGAFTPDTVVATYDGQDVLWPEYFYWLNEYAGYLDYLAMLGAFTYSDGWNGYDLTTRYTDGELVARSAWERLVQYRAVRALAAEQGVVLDGEDEAQVQENFRLSADGFGDSDGTCTDEEEAAFVQYLDEMGMERSLFEDVLRTERLSDKLFAALYGEEAAGYTDEYALAFAQEQGIMAAKHILLFTVDMTTGQPLSQEEIAQRKQTADELYEQLAAVQESPQELEALFDQLMEENSEDTGLAAYPDGYIFGEGTMVSAFEQTTKSLREYGLSEPVLSEYGYHIILRLPVDPDGMLMDASGQELTVRMAAAQADYTARLAAGSEAAEVVWKDGFETPDIAAIFGDR